MRANSKASIIVVIISKQQFSRPKQILGCWYMMRMHRHAQALACALCQAAHTFSQIHVFTHAGLAHGESYSVSFSVASGSRALAQLGMDLAGHGHPGHQSHPHIEVMKENSVPHTPTHGHRGEEAPRGHTGWRLRPHSHS